MTGVNYQDLLKGDAPEELPDTNCEVNMLVEDINRYRLVAVVDSARTFSQTDVS